MAIPKVIHYCWFGNGKIPEKDRKCIESWKKYCPDYEIKQWDESNYDVTKNGYLKYMYENKKYAFVSDYARLDIIYNNGGIYFDVDVEVIRNIDFLLENSCFFGLEKVDGKFYAATGLGFGAEKDFSFLKDNMKYYEDYDVKNTNSEPIPCPHITNNTFSETRNVVFNENQMYNVENITVYPTEYFAPKSYDTGKIHKTKNTCTIHHYDASWNDEKGRLYLKLSHNFGKKFAEYAVSLIYKFRKE